MVYVFLADGFEDIEALAPVDILRRAAADVRIVGVTGRAVTSSNGVTVQAGCGLDAVTLDGCDMLVLPGGGKGTENLKASPRVIELVRQAHERGITIAAICAAPAILAELGLLKGRKAVCYPSMTDELAKNGADVREAEQVVIDGNIITAKAAGASIDFGLELAAALKGREASEKVQNAIYYKA